MTKKRAKVLMHRGQIVGYPWEEWFSSGSFLIKRGRDYKGLTHGMISQIRNQAAKRRLSVHISVSADENLSVTVVGILPDKPKPKKSGKDYLPDA